MKQKENNEIDIITKRLDDACFIDFGTRVVQKKDGGDIYPVYGGGGATFKMNTYNRENCLVVSRFAMSKQCTRFVEGKFYLNDSGLTVRPKDIKELTQEYLDYLLLTLNDTIYSLSRGTAQRNLNVSKFRNLEIKYPDSIELQLHIANLLSKAENLIAQRKESIRLLDEFLKSTFLDMFGDPVRNEKGWEVEQLGKVTFMKAGQFVAASDIQSEFSEGLYSCYGGNGLRGYVKTYTHEGDFVLIGRQGALCGNVKIAKGQFHATEHAVVCSPKMQFETYWLYYLLDIINLNKYASGAAQPGLAVGRLEQIEIIYPPIELQTQFAQIVEKTEALKAQYQQSLQELENLYGSLSQQAFKGELKLEEKEESLLMAAESAPQYQARHQSVIPKNKKGFAKQVLGGKIVSLFKDDPNFTHIKFQKLQYLAEHIAEEDLLWNYYRQAAGPHDNKFRFSVIAKLNENKWFEERNYRFYPLQKINDIDRFYQNYFSGQQDKLNELFQLLKNASEKLCEAIATIYAVWNNHIILNKQFDKANIKTDFFDWSSRKEEKFTDDEFEKALAWMQKHNIVPTGFGQLIKEKAGKK